MAIVLTGLVSHCGCLCVPTTPVATCNNWAFHYLGGLMFSHTMSFKNACSSDSSAVMRFDGSNVSIRSNKSKASAGILRKTKTNHN